MRRTKPVRNSAKNNNNPRVRKPVGRRPANGERQPREPSRNLEQQIRKTEPPPERKTKPRIARSQRRQPTKKINVPLEKTNNVMPNSAQYEQHKQPVENVDQIEEEEAEVDFEEQTVTEKAIDTIQNEIKNKLGLTQDNNQNGNNEQTVTDNDKTGMSKYGTGELNYAYQIVFQCLCESMVDELIYIFTNIYRNSDNNSHFVKLLSQIKKWPKSQQKKQAKKFIEKDPAALNYFKLAYSGNALLISGLVVRKKGSRCLKIEIPSFIKFVHRVFVYAAKKFSHFPDAFNPSMPDFEKIRIQSHIETIFERCIAKAIRQMIPSKKVLETKDDEGLLGSNLATSGNANQLSEEDDESEQPSDSEEEFDITENNKKPLNKNPPDLNLAQKEDEYEDFDFEPMKKDDNHGETNLQRPSFQNHDEFRLDDPEDDVESVDSIGGKSTISFRRPSENYNTKHFPEKNIQISSSMLNSRDSDRRYDQQQY